MTRVHPVNGYQFFFFAFKRFFLFRFLTIFLQCALFTAASAILSFFGVIFTHSIYYIIGVKNPFFMQNFLRFKNGPFLPLLFFTSFL